MKPMLAATVLDVEALQYPLYVSPKLDGVRAIVYKGCVLSRSFKPIPNMQVQDTFSHLEGIDGELIVGAPNQKDCYRRTVSGVMTKDKTLAGLSFWAFDNIAMADKPFCERLVSIPGEVLHPHIAVHSVEELLMTEQTYLSQGYEGAILRGPKGRYKYGRSTLNEQGMMKLKRFSDSEGVVIGFIEQMHNGNEATIGRLGQTERSSHKANMHPLGTLGALEVKWQRKIFNIGTGFSQAERDEIWANRELLRGRVAKFKYMEIGMKDLPRHPVFLGWRA